MRNQTTNGLKERELMDSLTAGWCPASALADRFGWQRHTLRGAVSKLAKKHGLKIERRRENGTNEYRIARDEN
ncbi:DUF3489 domain-containing protein [Bradyrhizobium sp. CCBAU 53415]|uniref:DUF3489 domain-containing protein n=1 Tax=Bradyrhizobium sp. CCBAU 53415 TaxID=1325119 RepID=UPI003FA42254